MDISVRSSTTKYDIICLEEILNSYNLDKALKSVRANKGAPGIDHMTTAFLPKYLEKYGRDLYRSVWTGKYRSSPIRRVYIPKDNGQQRPLGIPTVIDRYIQQAVAQVLSEVYDGDFSDNSFGYRPGRNARQAIKRVIDIIHDGYGYVIDLDLSKFFDTVNHSKLLQILSSKIKDGRVISLIHKFLKAPVEEDKRVGPKTKIGTPQGGCISPILANILLNELDQLLDKRGIKFIRYADDMCIFAKSERAAQRILSKVTAYIERKLFLKVNTEKTKICRAGPEMQILGFTMKRVGMNFKKPIIPERCFLYPAVSKKKLEKFEAKIKVLLDRRAPGGIAYVKDKYNKFIRGWHNYYKGALNSGWMADICGRIRRRIRQLYWKQWKTVQNRYNNAKERYSKAPPIGYKGKGAFAYGSNRYWRIAASPALHKILGNRRLAYEGWLSLEDLEAAHWRELGLQKNIGTAGCGSARPVV